MFVCLFACEITDVLRLQGNSITGSLEAFCLAFIGGYYWDGELDGHTADCLETTVNCSCCTVCCDKDDQCIEMKQT